MEDSTIVSDLVAVGSIPNRIRVYDDLIYVVTSGEDNVKVIDPKEDTKILQTIGLSAGDNPWDIVFANKTKAYVTNYKTNTVAVIDLGTGSVTKKIDVGQSPEGLLYKDGKVYVANTGYVRWDLPYSGSSISIIDVATDKVTKTISTPINAQDLAIAPNGKLHVVCSGDYVNNSGKIAIIDISTTTLVDSILIGGAPGDIEITKDGIGYCVAWGDGTNGFLYSYNASTKAVINGANNPIKIAPNLSQLTYDENKNVLWIPYMTQWGGDGFVQKFDVTSNKVTWISNVVGNSSSAVAIYEYKK
jgi:YVTN family beta-propeller protein